jgi:hypothetical protein
MDQLISRLKNGYSTLNSMTIKYNSKLKIFFSVILILFAYKTKKDLLLSFISLSELILIWELSYFIFAKNTKVANLLNSILVLLFNIQQVSLIFGGTFISLIMLSNIDSIEADLI